MMKNLRQIRYNSRTETADQSEWRYEWYFLVLNQPREIERIKERIIEQFTPCGDFYELDSGVAVPGKSLHGRLITFNSNIGKITSPNRIYKAPDKFKKDRNLRPMTDLEFGLYVERIVKFGH